MSNNESAEDLTKKKDRFGNEPTIIRDTAKEDNVEILCGTCIRIFKSNAKFVNHSHRHTT